MITITFNIPEEVEPTYDKLLELMVMYGLDLLKGCENGCKDNNRKLIECKNIFFSACAAYNSGNVKVATTLFNFVTAQINSMYGETLPTRILEYDMATEKDINDMFKV